MELLDYEKRHIEYLENNAAEGTLFLKRDNTFPLDQPCAVALFGSGARQTIKGGTGSGDVVSRFFVNFEDGLKEAGFSITTSTWLDQYDAFKKACWKPFVKAASKEAKKNHYFPGYFSMGYFEEEKDYDFSIDYPGEMAIYVLARNSGEGNDRRLIPGDIYLSKQEIHDILELNRKFKKFILVLNVGGVIDLTPVLEVSNILYISQLGVVTGKILPRILLGKDNPSGKLAATWAKPEEYPEMKGFEDLHNIDYKEGIYVGYRYFDSTNKKVIFPFGFGLSYSQFEFSKPKIQLEGEKISVEVEVKNISKIPGKEVAQLYCSFPQGKLDKPYQDFVAFKKSKLLKEGEKQKLTLSFNLSDFASYDEEKKAYILEEGNYLLRLGNSSQNTIKIGYLHLKEKLNLFQVENQIGKPPFTDLKLTIKEDSIEGLEGYEIDAKAFKSKKANYHLDDYHEDELDVLSNEQLALLCLGEHHKGFLNNVGSQAVHVVGAAGETCLKIPFIKDSIVMADGPAGLRITQTYEVDKDGPFPITIDPIMVRMLDFLPFFIRPFMVPKKGRHGERHYQFTTALPIGTSLAMSMNEDYLYHVGEIVGEEMNHFGVHLWLAPAMNIQRNIRCGRNFEYYSEDPYLTGKIASSVIQGVQSKPHCGVTIKHFCCNNKELNRNNGNSRLSERSFREIYLKGFKLAIEEAKPFALMTSYNLLNGVHTSESYPLLNNILRNEIGFNGLIMSDWITSGSSQCNKVQYPAPYASNNILAGNDLTMSGTTKDDKDIQKALKKGKLKREHLLRSASKIYRAIKEINR